MIELTPFAKALGLILFNLPVVVLIVTILSVFAPVVSPVIFNAFPAVVIVVAPVKAPPNCTVPLVAVKPLFAALKTFTVELATPFTVLVKVPLESESALELIIFTAVAATPLTVVVKVFTDDAFEIEFTIGTAVAATPLTVVVKLFTDDVFEIEFTMGTEDPVTPLTVVVKVLAEEAFATPLTALLVAATPLTVLVKVLPDMPKV